MRHVATQAGSARTWLIAVSLATIGLLLSCGGSHTAVSSSPSGLLAGNWQIVLQQAPPSATSQTESGFLLQTRNALAGQLVLSGVCGGLGEVQGTTTGSDVGLTVSHAGQSVNLTGTAAGDGSTMTGTYAILASGCSSGSSTGAWTATPIKQVTGSYLATFNSYNLSAYSFSANVTQGPNTGSSIATLSGTMSSSNAPCASNVTLSGAVGGTSIVFNFLASDGTAVGQFTGTTSPDATSLAGTYDFIPQANGCAGDSGTISLIQQKSVSGT